MHSKAEGVFAGIPVLTAVFREVDPSLAVNPLVQDGDWISNGTVIVEIIGNVSVWIYLVKMFCEFNFKDVASFG
jgi:nicotinate-nucleotide pyrophosphorylase